MPSGQIFLVVLYNSAEVTFGYPSEDKTGPILGHRAYHALFCPSSAIADEVHLMGHNAVSDFEREDAAEPF